MTELKFQRFWLVEVVTADGLYCEDSPEKLINPYQKKQGMYILCNTALSAKI